MNKQLLSIFLFVGVATSALAQHIDISRVYEAGLPVLFIETVNSEEPTYDHVVAPAGCLGESIINATKVKGRVYIENSEGEILFDSNPYVKNTSGMKIKVRGNFSALEDKKPYKIKLEKKADLLLRGDTRFDDKDWILLKDENLKTMFSLKVNELLGMSWTPAYEYVNVVFNGEYIGLYMLLEAVGRNKDCRINVSKDGYIIEVDPYYWKEDVYFECGLYPYVKYTYKYPKEKELTRERADYIENYIASTEVSLRDGSYADYIDINSFARYMLVHDIIGCFDGAGSNMYLCKYDSKDTKLFLATTWDFGSAFETVGEWDKSHDGVFYHNLFYGQWDFRRPRNDGFGQALFGTRDYTFINTYKTLYNDTKTEVFAQMKQWLDSLSSSSLCVALNKSLVLDAEKWNWGGQNSVEVRAADTKQWLEDREKWLDDNVPNLGNRWDIFTTRTWIFLGICVLMLLCTFLIMFLSIRYFKKKKLGK